MSKHRNHMPRTGWIGPTPNDILAASGRENVMIRFRHGGGRQDREATLLIGAAYRGFAGDVVNFEARSADGRFTVTGVIENRSRNLQVTLDFVPVLSIVRRAV